MKIFFVDVSNQNIKDSRIKLFTIHVEDGEVLTMSHAAKKAP
jgi:hypothetical protein